MGRFVTNMRYDRERARSFEWAKEVPPATAQEHGFKFPVDIQGGLVLRLMQRVLAGVHEGEVEAVGDLEKLVSDHFSMLLHDAHEAIVGAASEPETATASAVAFDWCDGEVVVAIVRDMDGNEPVFLLQRREDIEL